MAYWKYELANLNYDRSLCWQLEILDWSNLEDGELYTDWYSVKNWIDVFISIILIFVFIRLFVCLFVCVTNMILHIDHCVTYYFPGPEWVSRNLEDKTKHAGRGKTFWERHSDRSVTSRLWLHAIGHLIYSVYHHNSSSSHWYMSHNRYVCLEVYISYWAAT